MALFSNKNLVFIDSMQFMNSSLEKLVKNLADDAFKYLTQKFGSKNLEFFKDLVKKNYLIKNIFTDL